jgi:hypothetical protein
MHRRSLLSSLVGVAWLAASPAAGGVLSQATWIQTIAGVSLVVTNSAATCTSVGPNIVQQTISCPGTGLDATGFASGMSQGYSVALTMPAFALTQFTTGGVIGVYTKATFGNGGQILIAGSRYGGGGSVQAPVAGMLTVKNTQHVATGVNASKRGPGFTTLVRVPVSVGRRGSITAYFHLLSEPHYLTVDFYGWTPNTWTFSSCRAASRSLREARAR